MNDTLFATLPLVLEFAMLLFSMIFLATYMHFPKMGRRKRLEASLKNAVYITLALVVLVYISLILILKGE